MKSIVTTTINNITVVSVSGPLVGGDETDELRRTLHEMVHQEQRKLVVDLNGVPYANSTGIGVLMSTYISYRRRGWSITLCGIGKEVGVIIAVTKLNLVFDIRNTREEAITHLSSIS